ncbi:MAG: 50S ribosomal protein L10 [Fimbriimonadales bacterium]
MPTQKKAEIIEQTASWISGSTGFIFTEYRGLGVQEIQTLRNQLRETGGEYHVVKNTLLRRALGEKATDLPDEFHNGPTATVFIQRDEAACAKKLFEFAKSHQALKIKGAVIEGKLLDGKQVEALSKLPSRHELLGMIAGCVAAPIANLVGVLQETIAAPIRAIGQVAEKRESAA